MKRIFLLALLVILPCCSGYYRVHHPSSDTTYYTRKIQGKKSGAIEFTDATSGDDVTLSDSAVRELTKEEFKAAVPAPK
jgi:hypothetical protein